MQHQPHTLVIGGGWAGLAAAIHAIDLGHRITVLEASRHWGGRARTLDPADGGHPLDNGQHILIGAYTRTLWLLKRLEIPLREVLYRQPLDLRFADGSGLYVPQWAQRVPPSLGLLFALVSAAGWTWNDKWLFLSTAAQWHRQGFTCRPKMTVAQLTTKLPAIAKQQLIDPLCLAALNTPAHMASAQVFLTVLRDALWGKSHPPFQPSDLLLPQVDLSRLLPEAACQWLTQKGADLRLAERVVAVERHDATWEVHSTQQRYQADRVMLACPAWDAARLVEPINPAWATLARQLKHTSIGTVYVYGRTRRKWPHPMVALHSHSTQAPAQFAFNRSALMDKPVTEPEVNADDVNPLSPIEVSSAPPPPLQMWSLVASATELNAHQLQAACMWQAQEQLGLTDLQAIRTIVEKRATFACVSGLKRPGQEIAVGLFATADYVENPYPATLEGALRNSFSPTIKKS